MEDGVVWFVGVRSQSVSVLYCRLVPTYEMKYLFYCFDLKASVARSFNYVIFVLKLKTASPPPPRRQSEKEQGSIIRLPPLAYCS
jgi:hypothetical protein